MPVNVVGTLELQIRAILLFPQHLFQKPGGTSVVVQAADALVRFHRDHLRPEPIFELARQGDLDVAQRRPDLVKALIFGDSSVKTDRTRQVMIDYHSYWEGWRKLAGFKGSFKELVRLVSEMPVDVPGQSKRTYGEGMDIISIMNKANYLRHLDPEVLTDWANGGEDASSFRRVIEGYDERLLKDIRCPVLLIQGNPRRGGIFTDEAVAFARASIKETYHVYIEEYDHNLGLYNWDTGKLLQAVNVFLETIK